MISPYFSFSLLDVPYQGVYYCRIQNKRGGGQFTIKKRTHKVVVSINRPYVYVMPMMPEFIPRPGAFDWIVQII